MENSACCKIPNTNRDFWIDKIRRNKERDSEEQRALAAMGWHCITVWECELKLTKREETLDSIAFTLNHIWLQDHVAKAIPYPPSPDEFEDGHMPPPPPEGRGFGGPPPPPPHGKGHHKPDNMRGFDPASEDDMDDNGMSRYMDNSDVRTSYYLHTDSGQVVAGGLVASGTIPLSPRTQVGEIVFPLDSIKSPNKLTLTLVVGASTMRNHWEIEVKP